MQCNAFFLGLIWLPPTIYLLVHTHTTQTLTHTFAYIYTPVKKRNYKREDDRQLNKEHIELHFILTDEIRQTCLQHFFSGLFITL